MFCPVIYHQSFLTAYEVVAVLFADYMLRFLVKHLLMIKFASNICFLDCMINTFLLSVNTAFYLNVLKGQVLSSFLKLKKVSC